MPFQVTRMEVISNNILMPEVTSNTIPDSGWQYHYNGTDQSIYVFATWKSEIDENFPPLITGTGTFKTIYWYMKIGKGGLAQPIIHCYAMFLGDEATNALFNQENPVDDVNGSEWTGGRDVSTANGPVTITPENTLNGENFDRWIKLWGNFQINGSTIMAPDQSYGAAIAVYAPEKMIIPEFKPEDVFKFVQQIVKPQDLVADFLDEYRPIVQALTDGDPRTQVQVKEAMAKLNIREPEALQKRLLEIRSDIHQLAAMEKVLKTFIR